MVREWDIQEEESDVKEVLYVPCPPPPDLTLTPTPLSLSPLTISAIQPKADYHKAEEQIKRSQVRL